MTTSLFWTRSCHLSCQKICTICLKPRMNPLCRWGHPCCFKTESGSRVGMFCKRLRRARANQHDRDSLQITKIKITTRTRDDLPAIRYLFPFCINSFLNFPKALQSIKKSNNRSCKGFSCMLIELHWFRATFVIVGWVKVKKSILGHGYKEISRRWAVYPLLNYSGRIM